MSVNIDHLLNLPVPNNRGNNPGFIALPIKNHPLHLASDRKIIMLNGRECHLPYPYPGIEGVMISEIKDKGYYLIGLRDSKVYDNTLAFNKANCLTGIVISKSIFNDILGGPSKPISYQGLINYVPGNPWWEQPGYLSFALNRLIDSNIITALDFKNSSDPNDDHIALLGAGTTFPGDISSKFPIASVVREGWHKDIWFPGDYYGPAWCNPVKSGHGIAQYIDYNTRDGKISVDFNKSSINNVGVHFHQGWFDMSGAVSDTSTGFQVNKSRYLELLRAYRVNMASAGCFNSSCFVLLACFFGVARFSRVFKTYGKSHMASCFLISI